MQHCSSGSVLLTRLDVELAPDGFKKPRGKAFNGTYPGPLIGMIALRSGVFID